VIGSLNKKLLIKLNTNTPITNPIKRDGHSSPLYASTIYPTDLINNQLIGIDTINIEMDIFYSNHISIHLAIVET
jgi:hypothetical protein